MVICDDVFQLDRSAIQSSLNCYGILSFCLLLGWARSPTVLDSYPKSCLLFEYSLKILGSSDGLDQTSSKGASTKLL